MSRGGLRRAAGGLAGLWVALGLAGVAGLTSFVATAGPREITRRVLDRSPLTTSTVPVPVQLYRTTLLTTAIILALAAITTEQLLTRRTNTATVLRSEEAT